MRGKFTVAHYIIMGLIAIGLIVSLKVLLIPICVFGIVFLLYKFPPSRWKQKNKAYSGRKTAKKRSKDATFRVIQGNKKSDSDDLPKYH
jgi:mannose/fructose/N-acetylgalactosamine-specific phosphotransferase system component IIC